MNNIKLRHKGHIVIYKDHNYEFPLNLSFERIQKIIEDYPYPKKIPDKANWWYRKTDFGVYFLDQIGNLFEYEKFLLSKVGIRESDWRLFRPVFRAYFPSRIENTRANANLQFLLGNYHTPVDDYYFMKYILLSKYGNLSNEELDNMRYKDALMLYKYIIGELITRNVALSLVKNDLIDQEKKEEEKQGEMVS